MSLIVLPRMKLKREVVGLHFRKYHIEGMPFPCAIHHFSGPEIGDPHDHPWDFTTHILRGWYTEQMFWPTQAGAVMAMRKCETGKSYRVKAERIHRVVEISEGGVWTFVIPGPIRRNHRYWRFDKWIAESRQWDESEFRPWEGETCVL